MEHVSELSISNLRAELQGAAKGARGTRIAALMRRAARELAGREEAELVMRRVDMPFEDCFTPEPVSGCWLWSKFIGKDGYGRYQALQGPRVAHRAAFEIYKGPIPEGLSVLHRCDVRCCVNPDHLWLGTYSDNMYDMHKKGRHRKRFNGRCSKGHKLTDDNVRINSGTGQRRCKICIREWDRNHYHTKKKFRQKRALLENVGKSESQNGTVA